MSQKNNLIDTPEPILKDKEMLLILYKEASEKDKFSVTNVWNNARFFTTITSALITISIAFIRTSDKLNSGDNLSIGILISLILIPIIVIVLSFIGIKNLEREYSRFLEWIAVIEKLREILGLYQEIDINKFPDDKYLLPRRFIESSFSSSEEFINYGLSKKGTLLYYFKALHYTYIILSILVLLSILWM
jgi:hypothetical protein